MGHTLGDGDTGKVVQTEGHLKVIDSVHEIVELDDVIECDSDRLVRSGEHQGRSIHRSDRELEEGRISSRQSNHKGSRTLESNSAWMR